MGKLFAPDSKLMQILSRVADILILNALFFVSCLPVITVGAAVTAMYSVCFRWDTEQEDRLFRSYWRGFCGNLKQATAMWLIILAVLCVCCVDLFAAEKYGGIFAAMAIVFKIVLVLTLTVAGYAFPTLSQYHNTVGRTLKNALLLSLSYLLRTFAITVLNILPLLVLILDISLFIKLCPFLAMFYFSGTAYLIRQILKPVYEEQEDKNATKYAERNHEV